ncbi:MAG: glycosyltransferase family 39 protein, partial [Anaerolineae bacterium]
LRLIRLDFQPLWWDEGYSVFFATRDFLTMLARTAVDIHPPLYYALLQLWIPLFGKSDIALRLFSVLIGLAAIPLLYLLGRMLFSQRVGRISALLLALSPLHIYYSQEVRMYGLVTLLALASLVLQVALLRKANSRRLFFWTLYVLVTAAALYTQYFAAFIIAAEIVVTLFVFMHRDEPAAVPYPLAGEPPVRSYSSLYPWIAAWFATFILYLPWLVYAGPKLYTYVTAKVGIEQYPRLDPLTFIGQHLVAFSIGHVSSLGWLGVATLGLVALALFGILHSKFIPQSSAPRTRRFEFGVFLALIYLLLPFLFGWLVNLVYSFHPIRYERLLLFCAPLFLLFVARGIDALWQRRAALAWGALAGMTLVSAISLYDFYTVERYTQEDYRQMIQEMDGEAQMGDVVLAPYPWQIGYLESYYHGPTLNVFEVPADAWARDTSLMDKGLEGLRSQSPRVWLLAYQTQGRRIEDQLANFYAGDYHLWDNWYGNTRLEYFGQAADPAITEQPIDLTPSLQLASYGASSAPIPAGSGFVSVRLHWIDKSNAYNYSLRLVSRSGDKSLQQDEPISASNEVERIGLVIPRTFTPGEYDVRLVVYRRSDGAPAPLPDGNAELVLSHITITAPR